MKIVLAKTAGFCMGVRRAVELALDAPSHCKAPICTFGPLIHNPQVLDLLEERGIKAIAEIPETGAGTVLIRAHGVPPETQKQLEAAGFNVIDATCPKVIRVQTIIDQHARKGFATIIVGDKDHPEVIGLLGFSRQNGHVVGSLEELKALPPFEKAVIVAQTTQNTVFFEAVKAWVRRDFPHYKIFDTICDSTENRQAEVRELAGAVDALVVVGGRNSGNTQRLAHIARETGVPTVHIETEDDLDPALLAKARRIGLTAGASTPNWIIRRVYRTLETLPASKIKSIGSVLFTLERGLLLTNTYAALGAGCLCYAASRLQGISGFLPAGIISILYILTMHVMNNLTGTKADRYNDPDRAAFYKNHQTSLIALALAAGLLCLAVAWSHGLKPFLVISLMSLMGLSYNLRLTPKAFFFGKYLRIRDIPGSKTILIAMAWGVVTSIYPLLTVNGKARWATFFAFLWTTSLVFVRTAFSDIIDVQGDRIVGKETIPILLGEKRTMRILKITSAGMGGAMLIAGALMWVPSLAFLLSVCPLLMLAIFIAHERDSMLPGIRLEFLIESHFVLAGVLTFLWSVL
jgi:(E)-4-hydroxy-3-methyl-but-2-enyl pyrophosphate reductase